MNNLCTLATLYGSQSSFFRLQKNLVVGVHEFRWQLPWKSKPRPMSRSIPRTRQLKRYQSQSSSLQLPFSFKIQRHSRQAAASSLSNCQCPHIPSLKLTEDMIRWHPKKETSFPTLHFEVRAVSFRESNILSSIVGLDEDTQLVVKASSPDNPGMLGWWKNRHFRSLLDSPKQLHHWELLQLCRIYIFAPSCRYWCICAPQSKLNQVSSVSSPVFAKMEQRGEFPCFRRTWGWHFRLQYPSCTSNWRSLHHRNTHLVPAKK